ncbi:MAG: SDR family oxidoreductase [Actinomycetota bacterium]|nr:SDR family oxidoreductase [Actinomycetota bacterium]
MVTLARKLGADVFSYSRSETSTDVTSAQGVENALRVAYERTGRMDFVANTAPTLVRSPLAEMSVAAVEDSVATNYVAAAIVARATLPFLRETQGSRLLFTSSSYTRGRAGYSIYSSSKAAVVNLTQALFDEWDELSVRVNCLNTERTRTPMRSKALGDESIESLLAADDVAQSALAVLASDWTGHVVDVRRPTDAASA